MKLRERRKEKQQFKKAYKTATREEKHEMILDYIVEHDGQDRFIKRVERSYNRHYWSNF